MAGAEGSGTAGRQPNIKGLIVLPTAPCIAFVATGHQVCYYVAASRFTGARSERYQVIEVGGGRARAQDTVETTTTRSL